MTLRDLLGFLDKIPYLAAYLAPVGLLFLCTLFFGLFGGRKGYPAAACALAAAAFVILAVKDLVTALCYVALFSALAAALPLLFCIKRKKRVKKPKDERMYEKFREPLFPDAPPKVCCYEETPAVSGEECGMQLGHADDLISTLKKSKLSPADRLEIDGISASLDRFRGKKLTEGEFASLNDALAAILKFTAKYKL